MSREPSLQCIEVVVFCVLLYLYTRRNVKHIVVVMLLVALLGTDQQNLPRSEGTDGTVFGIQSSFCCLATKNGHLLSSFHLREEGGGGKQINTDEKFFFLCSKVDK